MFLSLYYLIDCSYKKESMKTLATLLSFFQEKSNHFYNHKYIHHNELN